MGDTADRRPAAREEPSMNIGVQVRTLYIEPIEEPPPDQIPAPVERVPDPLPDPAVHLEPVP